MYSITGRTCKVINELGNRFLEFVYERVFIIVLSDAGFFIQAQRLVKGHFHRDIGNNFCSDLFVKEEEVRAIAPEHQVRIINYLNVAGIRTEFLINFGKIKFEFKRFTRNAKRPNIDTQNKENSCTLM